MKARCSDGDKIRPRIKDIRDAMETALRHFMEYRPWRPPTPNSELYAIAALCGLDPHLMNDPALGTYETEPLMRRRAQLALDEESGVSIKRSK